MKKTKEVSFNYKGKKFNINAKVCRGIFSEAKGLMFKSRENAEALLFNFKKPVNMKIHSLFVFFPFIAIWLDKKNKVIEIKRINPFTIGVKPKKPFNKLIEVPVNKNYKSYIKLLSS